MSAISTPFIGARVRQALPIETWLLAALLVALPLLNRELPVVGGPAVLPAVLFVGLVAIVPALQAGFRPHRSWVVLTTGGYVALRLVGALRHDTIGDVIRVCSLPVVVFIGFIGVAAVVWRARRCGAGQATTRVLLAALLLAGLISSVAALLMREGSLAVADGGSVIENRATGLFGQPNELGAWSALGVVLAASLLQADRAWLRSLAILCLALDGVALLISTSRGAWLGTGLGLLFLFVSQPRLRRPLLLAAGGIVTAAWVAVLAGVRPAVGLLELVASRVTSAGNIETAAFDDRPAIYAQAWDTWLSHPLVGVGTSMFEEHATAADSAVRVVNPLHAHSLVLHTLAEGGLLGMLSLVAMVFAVILVHLQFRRSGREMPALHVSGTAMVIAAAGQGALDYPWTNAVLLVAAFVALGLVGPGDQQPLPINSGNRTNGEMT